MSGAILLVLFLSLTEATLDARDPVEAFLDRVELAPWPNAHKSPLERIKWDEEGRLVMLRLDGMRLSAADIDLVSRLSDLEHLSLRSTTITDADLSKLARLGKLKGIALDETAIGDEGVIGLAEFPALRTVCLRKVKAGPEAVRVLKAKRPKLGIGYVQRAN
jgi:hypothetical protein